MPTERIILEADNIDGAAEKIIHFLEDLDEGRDVIYFHGRLGWGASAVLKVVAERLRSTSRSTETGTTTTTTGGLEKIIHIDFSRWQSKRALQKVIAEEVELPPQVMALFDQHDEEDDFDGVEQSARGVIPYVKIAIMNELISRRFLVILHNGSGSYIDLWEFGVPVLGQLSRRVLWTSRGRFWHHSKEGHGVDSEPAKLESAKLSDVAIFVIPSAVFKDDRGAWIHVLRHFLCAEAEEVAKYTCVPEPDMTPKIVMECILYMALLSGNDHNISWEFHVSNYWVCDGIIQDGIDGGRSAWEIGDALQRNMNWEFCNWCTKAIRKVLSGEEWFRPNRWVSVSSNDSRKFQVPSQATSFFWTAAAPSPIGRVLEASMFEHSSDRSSSLRVIHLCHCNFSFSSPPFLSCNNLRFLVLDHCKDQDELDHYGGEKKEYHHPDQHTSNCSQQGNAACFQNLWVLQLSYTDWYWLLSKDMLDLMVDLRELHLKGISNRSMMHLHRCSGAGSNSHRLIKILRVVAVHSNKAPLHIDDSHGTSGQRKEQVSLSQLVVPVTSFPDVSSWHILKTVILDGCGELELIDSNALPLLSLESFTLISNVNANNKIKSISFNGCSQLKSLLLRGLFDNLEELDMSGTAIKTLDLSATQAMHLKRLLLLGCQELRAILWPQEENKKVALEVLCIDTNSTNTTHATWDVEEEGKSNKQQEASSDNTSIRRRPSSATVVCGKKIPTLIDMDSYISVRDPRFFRSLLHLGHAKRLQVEISPTSNTCGRRGTTNNQGISNITSCCGGGGSKQVLAEYKPAGNMYIDDVISSIPTRSSSSGSSMWLWHCPPAPTDSDWANCYISIQDDDTRTRLLLQGAFSTTTKQLARAATTLPPLVSEGATTLHLHDSLSITCLPGPAPATERNLGWGTLEWCRLERCPNLEGVVFIMPSIVAVADIFYHLKTFWASQLPKARYIWDWSGSQFRPGPISFQHLVFLHLDYCHRLVHVVPLYASNTNGCRSLEILEIVCCGNLREVFPSDTEPQQQQPARREFPRLKHIHLFDLPKLKCICGHSRMLAPNLETVKIRGCWSLKRLPAVRQPAQRIRSPAELRRVMLRIRRPPTVDCEKDWWDGLEWDGKAAGHHPSHYKATHSAYCKKTRLITTLLR